MSDTPVAVITGAASGIGAACARRMRADGWRTAGLDLNPSATDRPAIVDVTDRAAVKAAVDGAVEEFGRVDLLVSAAGYYEEGIDVVDISIDQWDRMLAVILGGTVNSSAAVLPHMIARDTGTIVAISSELALGGSATDLHYVAAKGAVLGLGQIAGDGDGPHRHPGQRRRAGADRHPAARAGLALAPARLPRHPAARPAGDTGRDRRRRATTSRPKARSTAARSSHPTQGR